MGWILLSVIYLVLLVVFGVLTFRKGHWILGLIGFIPPRALAMARVPDHRGGRHRDRRPTPGSFRTGSAALPRSMIHPASWPARPPAGGVAGHDVFVLAALVQVGPGQRPVRGRVEQRPGHHVRVQVRHAIAKQLVVHLGVLDHLLHRGAGAQHVGPEAGRFGRAELAA